MGRYNCRMYLGGLGLFLVCCLVYVVPLKAGDWRSKFTTKQGVDCCGVHDCRPLATGYWVKVGDRYVVFPGQPETEITVVHPSQDGKAWICTTGCGFQPGTS